MSNATDFVCYALRQGALEIFPAGKERKLKSERMSPYFFNSGLFCTAQGALELARYYVEPVYDLLKGYPAESCVLFGPPYKGIPLAVTVAEALYMKHDFNCGWASNRKETKDHGEGGLLVGSPVKDKYVLILDDVITTGASKDDAVGLVTEYGGIPIGIAVGFDREEAGVGGLSAAQECQQRHGIPVVSVGNLSALVQMLSETGHGDLQRILAYQNAYGAKAA